MALNPTRADSTLGSFINLNTGRWKDFATGDAGGDLISLNAYVHRLTQCEAALQLQNQLYGQVHVHPTIPSKAPKASNDAQWIAGLWDRGMDVHGTIAEAYLYHRGIGGTLPE